MDVFKQKKYLWFVVILLVLMNLTILMLLLVGRPDGKRPHIKPIDPIEEKNRIQQLLKDELGFDEMQVEQYLNMRQEHRKQVSLLQNEIRQIKKQMYDEVLQDKPQLMLPDSLLTIAQEKQVQIEQITFQHFLDLKKLCNQEQQDKLRLLIDEFFRKNPPHRRGNDHPPPPPGGKQP